MKAVLRGKFIVIQVYLKKIETFQVNNLTLCLQEPEEQQQRQPRTRLNKVKKTEIISSIFSDHRGMKLESNLKKKTQKTFTFMETKWHAMKQ